MDPSCLGFCALTGLVSFFFTRLRKFWSLFLQIDSQSLALSLLLVPLSQGCYASCIPNGPLTYSFLHFCCSDWVFFFFLVLKIADSILCFIQPVFLPVYSVLVLYSSFLIGPFFMVYLFPCFEQPVTISLNSISDKLPPSVSFSYFSGDFLVL